MGEPALELEYPPVNEDIRQRAGAAVRELILALGPEPAPEQATLDDLLAQCKPARRSRKDRDWLAGPPAGRELI